MQQNSYVFQHSEYGTIRVTLNKRARRIIMRAQPDAIYVTMPPGATNDDLCSALKRFAPELSAQREKLRSVMPCFDTPIVTENFIFRLHKHSGDKFQLQKNGKEYILLIPASDDIDTETRRNWLRKIVYEAMLQCAKEVLPVRLQSFAEHYSFKYKRVVFRASKTRWGSCSSNGTISLNTRLVLLPDALIDYVLLHELCHTREMNHGADFWKLLDSVTDGRSKELRNELRHTHIVL